MITYEQMSYEDMKQTVADGYSCGQCGGRLSVAWGGSFGHNGYILRCLKDIEHKTINRHDVEREQKIQQIKEIRKLDSKSLMNMSDAQMIERVNLTRFPNTVTIVDKKMLVKVALTYGFDPLMGELMVYQGRPFVTIDGRYRKAQETGLLDGVNTRPATRQEKEDWGIPLDDYYFKSEVFVKGATHPFIGWGRVRKSETAAGSTKDGDNSSTYKPIQNNPQRMAEKRAEAQALRKAFSIPLPSAEDIGSPDADPGVYTVTSENYSIKEVEAEIVDGMPEGLRAQSQSDKDFEAMESASQKEPEPVAASPVDLDWLQDSLARLKDKKITAWSSVNTLAKLNTITGKKAARISEAVMYLNKEQATAFIKQVQEAVDMA
jgi:hypothetical protein